MKRKQLLLLAAVLPGLMAFAQDGKHAGGPASVDAETAAAAGSVATASTPLNSYVLGPADMITVTVWKEPTLSGPLLVRPDGMVSLPLHGDIIASSKTPLQPCRTPDYHSKKIYVLRELDGKQQKIPVQYKRALKGDSQANLALKAGDTIVVP